MTSRIDSPPTALKALVVVLGSASVWSLATAFSNEPKREASPVPTMLVITRSMSLVMVIHRACMVLVSPPVSLELIYGEGSAFEAKPIELNGRRRMCTFTVQSWFLLGAYFAISLVFPNLVFSRVVFGVVFSTAHIVSSLTTYVLIPKNAKQCEKLGTDIRDTPFYTTNGLVMHNVNVLLVHIDMLVSGETMKKQYAGAAVLWAIWYVLFAWRLAKRERWVPYPFIDFTLPIKFALPIHLGLAFLLALFYLIGVVFSQTLAVYSLPVKLLAHVSLLFLVMRIMPPTTRSKHS